MSDELNRMYTWLCPHCGQRHEETDMGQLEVRMQMHKCKTESELQKTAKEVKN